MIRTLRLKFICVTMALVTVFLTVILCLLIHTTAMAMEKNSIDFLRQAAGGSTLSDPPGQARLPCFIIRVTPWEQSLESSGGFDLSNEPMLTDIVARAASAESKIGVLKEYSLRYFRMERHGGFILVFADISGEIQTLRGLTVNCVFIGLAALLVFFGVSILLARWAIRPVEQAWQEQRQFVADASHELNTPLTVIMTNAELLQSDPSREQYARSILTMSRQMRALVEGLLELTRVDNGAVRAAFDEVDLTELVADELLPFEPVYFERGLTLQSDIAEGVRISGSPRHLRQVLGILLDNAMKYSPEDSDIWVRLTKQGGNALLTVTNPGAPMSREDCQHIFRRFYRADPSRSSGGYGLGLPIAKGIIADHGGKIWAESRDGLVILSVQLPIKRS